MRFTSIQKKEKYLEILHLLCFTSLSSLWMHLLVAHHMLFMILWQLFFVGIGARNSLEKQKNPFEHMQIYKLSVSLLFSLYLKSSNRPK